MVGAKMQLKKEVIDIDIVVIVTRAMHSVCLWGSRLLFSSLPDLRPMEFLILDTWERSSRNSAIGCPMTIVELSV
jgi:hypothetical protein